LFVIPVKKITLNVIGSALVAMLAAPACAVDGMALETGQADRTDMARVAVQWQWTKRWVQGDGWHLGGHWDLSAARWERDPAPESPSSLTEIGLTPVFRLQADGLRGAYLEGGIGAHWLSSTKLGDKRFGSTFQFGEHLGFGYRFGVRSAYDLSYRYQHLSNANIKDPNDGVNFHQLRLLYWFQ
jgi:opacity protein-like surface antigen